MQLHQLSAGKPQHPISISAWQNLPSNCCAFLAPEGQHVSPKGQKVNSKLWKSTRCLRNCNSKFRKYFDIFSAFDTEGFTKTNAYLERWEKLLQRKQTSSLFSSLFLFLFLHNMILSKAFTFPLPQEGRSMECSSRFLWAQQTAAARAQEEPRQRVEHREPQPQQQGKLLTNEGVCTPSACCRGAGIGSETFQQRHAFRWAMQTCDLRSEVYLMASWEPGTHTPWLRDASRIPVTRCHCQEKSFQSDLFIH